MVFSLAIHGVTYIVIIITNYSRNFKEKYISGGQDIKEVDFLWDLYRKGTYLILKFYNLPTTGLILFKIIF